MNNNSVMFSVPDICDAHADNIQIGSLSFNSYGAKDIISGEIQTISCPDDNSLVKEILNQPGNNKVLIIDARRCKSCIYDRRPDSQQSIRK
jgi:regulator of ribonuclease activity A